MTTPSAKPEVESDSADLFDYPLLKDYGGFLIGATQRRRYLVLGVFAGVLAATVVGLVTLPKTYHVETRILAQRNQVMPALGNPNRAIPYDADAPTRAATETVIRRDNLVSLIKQTNLLDQWDLTRAPALRVKDALVRVVKGVPSDEDRIDALVGLLEKRLLVITGEGTVTISIDWNDAQMAFRLVESAQQNFLEARHVSEISTIAEAISILEGHAANVHEAIQSSMEEVEKSQRSKNGKSVELAISDGARKITRKRVAPDQEAAQLKVMLNAKRRAIQDLEEFRQRRLSELQAQLTEQKAIYAEAHPVVVNIQQSIDALVLESPQIAALKKEEQQLAGEFARRGGTKEEEGDPSQTLPTISEESLRIKAPPPSTGNDTAGEYAWSRMRTAIQKYDMLLERIDSARIELDTARAAFKYRYSVIRPAQVPRSPISPNPVVMIMAGLVAGVLLAMFAALAADIRSGRIFERWQVERLLELPVLADLRKTL